MPLSLPLVRGAPCWRACITTPTTASSLSHLAPFHYHGRAPACGCPLPSPLCHPHASVRLRGITMQSNLNDSFPPLSAGPT